MHCQQWLGIINSKKQVGVEKKRSTVYWKLERGEKEKNIHT